MQVPDDVTFYLEHCDDAQTGENHLEHIRQWLQVEAASDEYLCVRLAAHALKRLEEIAKEKDNAKCLEQARALLVAAHGAGLGSMGVTDGGIAFYFGENTGLRYDANDGAAQSLANCVRDGKAQLRERDAK